MVTTREAPAEVSFKFEKATISDHLRAHAVVSVKHAGDSVKSEPIKLILVHPEA
jgi:hypothetical protein